MHPHKCGSGRERWEVRVFGALGHGQKWLLGLLRALEYCHGALGPGQKCLLGLLRALEYCHGALKRHEAPDAHIFSLKLWSPTPLWHPNYL